MTKQPIIFALANPTPEIMPEDARKVAPDAIIATGRSDFPNQVNNVLCFPFIFRGALDVGATDHQRRDGAGVHRRHCRPRPRDHLCGSGRGLPRGAADIRH